MGTPDFAFLRERVIVFTDGCFWHACPLHCIPPKRNPLFWTAKLNRNRTRDRRTVRSLRLKGWMVLRIWEHEIRQNPGRCIARLRRCLTIAEAKKRLLRKNAPVNGSTSRAR